MCGGKSCKLVYFLFGYAGFILARLGFKGRRREGLFVEYVETVLVVLDIVFLLVLLCFEGKWSGCLYI